jgi:hypothetical protein
VSRDHTVNGLFEALSRNGIEVISLRNKQNRLERLFLDIVDLPGAAPCAPEILATPGQKAGTGRESGA